jgi:peroxiredoxin Q/BCP
MMIEVGRPAPAFLLRDQDGVEVSLESLRGRPLVLYFYPKDGTPVCTRQACLFRDAWDEVEAAGARVVGISPDSVKAHARFAARHGLPFTLLADPELEACAAYGVWNEKSLFGRTFLGVVRTTFVLDAQGIVRTVFPRVKVGGHTGEVLAAVRAL